MNVYTDIIALSSGCCLIPVVWTDKNHIPCTILHSGHIYHYFLSITASRSEAITVMQYNRFDNINNLFYASYTEHVCPKSELVKIYDDEVMVNIMFNTALHFQQLGISVTEMLLTLSVIITMPGKYTMSFIIRKKTYTEYKLVPLVVWSNSCTLVS